MYEKICSKKFHKSPCTHNSRWGASSRSASFSRPFDALRVAATCVHGSTMSWHRKILRPGVKSQLVCVWMCEFQCVCVCICVLSCATHAAHACMRPHNVHACIRTRTCEHTCTCARTRTNTCPHILRSNRWGHIPQLWVVFRKTLSLLGCLALSVLHSPGHASSGDASG